MLGLGLGLGLAPLLLGGEQPDVHLGPAAPDHAPLAPIRVRAGARVRVRVTVRVRDRVSLRVRFRVRDRVRARVRVRAPPTGRAARERALAGARSGSARMAPP